MTPNIVLNNGAEIPRIGLGVFLVTDVAECESSVAAALDAGYRLIDTANAYRNERAVGRAIRESGVDREQIFLTTKLWPGDYGVRASRDAIRGAVERLDSGHIDLLLLHQPVGDVLGAWKAMEDAVESGAVRSIGVSNFEIADLERLLASARIRPVVDQIELHPYWQAPALLPYLAEHEIVPQAWYPLGHGSKKLLSEPAIRAAAAAHGRSPVQVILRWHRQRGFVAIPKSTNPAHIASNIDIDDFALTDLQMSAIDALGRNRPMVRMPRWVMSAVMPRFRVPQLP
ncbi:aldo/keto reductase [Microbacter sp. GSS18]|nr:aldo/keto reductase [Microbacter sp. GSS18]